MAKTKTKPRARAKPRVQAPQPASKRSVRLPWLIALGIAAATFAVVLGALWLTNDEDAASPPAEKTATGTLPATPDYHSLIVHPQNPRRIWLGTHQGLHESTDGGRSWASGALVGQDAMNLSRSQASQTVWVAGHEVLARSADGGETWEDARPPGLPNLDLHGFAAHPRKPNVLYAAAANEGLYRSMNGGKSFTLVSRDVGPGVMALAITPSGRVLAGDMQQGLMVSDDGGKGWRQTLAEGVMGLSINPQQAKRVLATSQGGIFLSEDGGATWRNVRPIPGGAGPTAWATAKLAYVVGYDRFLYRSRDAGSSWQPVG
jgi:hypothetical protein